VKVGGAPRSAPIRVLIVDPLLLLAEDLLGHFG
jgi:hypothetical protein